MNAPGRTVEEVKGAFYALASVVRLWRPLDEETHATLRQLAIDYMHGYVPEYITDDPQAYTLNSFGSYLASALGDADLKQMVIDMIDELGGLVELHLEQWYDPDVESTDRDQLDQND